MLHRCDFEVYYSYHGFIASYFLYFNKVSLPSLQSPWGVASGAIAGHLIATSIAILGGAFLAKYISEKLVRAATFLDVILETSIYIPVRLYSFLSYFRLVT